LCAFSLELLFDAEISPESLMDMDLMDRAIFYVKSWLLMVYPWSIRGCFWYAVGWFMGDQWLVWCRGVLGAMGRVE
jgi:hypothetical protein